MQTFSAMRRGRTNTARNAGKPDDARRIAETITRSVLSSNHVVWVSRMIETPVGLYAGDSAGAALLVVKGGIDASCVPTSRGQRPRDSETQNQTSRTIRQPDVAHKKRETMTNDNTDNKPVLRVRFTKARMISLPGDNSHVRLRVGPARTIETNAAKTFEQFTSRQVLTHDIVMSDVFDIRLPELTPKPLKRRPEYTPNFAAALEEAEMRRCIQNRADAEKVIEKIRVYSTGPASCLEVVEDSHGLVSSGELDLSEAERELTGLVKEKTSIESAAEAAKIERLAQMQSKQNAQKRSGK